MDILSKIIEKHLTADYGGYNHYEPYMDRWQEPQYHHPEDYSPAHGMSPEGVPTKVFDTGDFAEEQAYKLYYQPNTQEKQRVLDKVFQERRRKHRK
jgi:hypothetical protein